MLLEAVIGVARETPVAPVWADRLTACVPVTVAPVGVATGRSGSREVCTARSWSALLTGYLDRQLR